MSVEVIVVDDGSSEQPPDRLGDGDPRLRIVRLPERRGVAAARNAGIAVACGEWIAFLDDDDTWSPRKLRTQLDTADREAADVVYAGVVSVGEDGRARYAFPLPEPDGLRRRLLTASLLPAGCSNVIARAELVRALGGFDEDLHQLADWDLWLRLAWAGRIAACDEILTAYLEHDQNMLLSDPGDVTLELEHLERKHRQLRAAEGVALDRAAFAHWVAWGHLRRRRRLRAAAVYLRSGLRNRRLGDLYLAAAFVTRAALPVVRLARAWPRGGSSSVPPPPVQPDWLGVQR